MSTDANGWNHSSTSDGWTNNGFEKRRKDKYNNSKWHSNYPDSEGWNHSSYPSSETTEEGKDKINDILDK